MITKERIFKQFESLLGVVNIEALIERLLLIDKIDTRIAESDNDRAISEEQLDKELNGWFS